MRVERAMRWGCENDDFIQGVEDVGGGGRACQAHAQEAIAIANLVEDAVIDMVWSAWILRMEKICLLLREASVRAPRCFLP